MRGKIKAAGKMKKVDIYTDGACFGNPGAGGWAAVLIYKGTEKQISGYVPNTTNNRMELMAVLQAVKALKEPCDVTLYTDSAYIQKAFTQGWIKKWEQNGWKTSSKQPVENQELWKGILATIKPHKIIFVKVKGHSDNKYNNLCDAMAKKAIKENEGTGVDNYA